MPNELRFRPRPVHACLTGLLTVVLFGAAARARPLPAAQGFALPTGVLPSGDYDRSEVPLGGGVVARPLGRGRVTGEGGMRSLNLCRAPDHAFGPYRFAFLRPGPQSVMGMATSVYRTPEYDVWVVPHPETPGLPRTYELHFGPRGATNFGRPGLRHEHWTPRDPGGPTLCLDLRAVISPSLERDETRDKPRVPTASRRELERHLHASLDCLWHAIALTRNAVPAVSLSRQFGRRTEIECRERSAELIEGLDLGACWALLPPPRALLTEADRLFTEARKTPEPREGELVRAGEERIAQARPLVERAVECYQELVRRHTAESHGRR